MDLFAVLRAALVASLPAESIPVAIAYSGGPDSSALLHMLSRIGRSVRAIHVDHGLHPQATAWVQHAKRTCTELSIPLTVLSAQVDPRRRGEEAAAREARYAAIANELAPDESILTAHHQRDQVESFLIALLRGAGIDGLASMPRRRPLGQGWLLRPWLGVDKSVIDGYVVKHGLATVSDPSNEDDQRLRSQLRSQVLPALIAAEAAAVSNIARSIEHLGQAKRIVDHQLASDMATVRRDDGLSALALSHLPLWRRNRVLLAYCRQAGIKPPATKHLQVWNEQLHAQGAGIDWPGGATRCWQGHWFVGPPQRFAAGPRDYCASWDGTGDLRLPGNLGSLRIAPAVIQPSNFKVRFRQGGETLTLPGRTHSTSLKNVLHDRGLPPWERARVPLLYADDELLAIGALTKTAAWDRYFSDQQSLRVRFDGI